MQIRAAVLLLLLAGCSRGNVHTAADYHAPSPPRFASRSMTPMPPMGLLRPSGGRPWLTGAGR